MVEINGTVMTLAAARRAGYVTRARTMAEMKYGNPKYQNEHGLCCTDENGVFIRDAEGNLIPADLRTGEPKSEIKVCPTCRRPMVKKP